MLQFCWECGGPFHTVVSCSRPRIVADAGSILAFDDLDKKCASHFLSRQVAQKGRHRCLRLLAKCNGRNADALESGHNTRVGLRVRAITSSSCNEECRDECDSAAVLSVKAEGWAVLAEAQV